MPERLGLRRIELCRMRINDIDFELDPAATDIRLVTPEQLTGYPPRS